MDIKEVHKINLLLLKEVDRICKKYNIKYRLEAGTLLGAIRHKGFIPWDDDCDVVFLRDEYDKFLEALNVEKLSDDMVFVKAVENDDYFHDFTDRLFYIKKVYREGKEYREWFNGYYQYLWLDFFVLDNIPTDKTRDTVFKQKIIYGLATAHRQGKKFKSSKNVFLNFSVFLLSIAGRFFSLSKLYNMQSALSKKYRDVKNTKYVYFSNYPPIWLGYKTERNDENDIIYTDFEDTKLPAIKNYDKILKYYYGDYMKLPKIEKQIPEHYENLW